MASKPAHLARALQVRTGWSYTECLRCVRARLSEAEICALLAQRADSSGSASKGA